MIFLIEYDRDAGRIIQIRFFDAAKRGDAEAARLALELKLNRALVAREVVLLEAADEEALRKTHGRYFEDLSGLATPRST